LRASFNRSLRVEGKADRTLVLDGRASRTSAGGTQPRPDRSPPTTWPRTASALSLGFDARRVARWTEPS